MAAEKASRDSAKHTYAQQIMNYANSAMYTSDSNKNQQIETFRVKQHLHSVQNLLDHRLQS